MFFRCVSAALLLGLMNFALAGEEAGKIYEWVDENGKKVYSDQKPLGIESQEKKLNRVNSGSVYTEIPGLSSGEKGEVPEENPNDKIENKDGGLLAP